MGVNCAVIDITFCSIVVERGQQIKFWCFAYVLYIIYYYLLTLLLVHFDPLNPLDAIVNSKIKISPIKHIPLKLELRGRRIMHQREEILFQQINTGNRRPKSQTAIESTHRRQRTPQHLLKLQKQCRL